MPALSQAAPAAALAKRSVAAQGEVAVHAYGNQEGRPPAVAAEGGAGMSSCSAVSVLAACVLEMLAVAWGAAGDASCDGCRSYVHPTLHAALGLQVLSCILCRDLACAVASGGLGGAACVSAGAAGEGGPAGHLRRGGGDGGVTCAACGSAAVSGGGFAGHQWLDGVTKKQDLTAVIMEGTRLPRPLSAMLALVLAPATI